MQQRLEQEGGFRRSPAVNLRNTMRQDIRGRSMLFKILRCTTFVVDERSSLIELGQSACDSRTPAVLTS